MNLEVRLVVTLGVGRHEGGLEMPVTICFLDWVLFVWVCSHSEGSIQQIHICALF